jgi:hypothetical protein
MKPTTTFALNLRVQPSPYVFAALTKWIVLLLSASLLLLTSCKKDPGVVTPTPTPPTPVPVLDPLFMSTNITTKTTLADRIADPELPDYIVTKNIDINAELTINPGVVIAFERDIRLNINDNGGLLIAKGTADKKIRFIGVQKTKGFWVGIAHYSGSNANVLEFVEVLHAGSRPLYSTTKAALFLSGGSKAQIGLRNTLFAQNDG